jgi:hypothetical protein
MHQQQHSLCGVDHSSIAVVLYRALYCPERSGHALRMLAGLVCELKTVAVTVFVTAKPCNPQGSQRLMGAVQIVQLPHGRFTQQGAYVC